MKPCPFCGSENVGYSYGAHPDGRELSFISCSDCGARGPARTYLCLADDDESEGAWDTRHNVQAQGRCAALSRSVPWSAGVGVRFLKHCNWNRAVDSDRLPKSLDPFDFVECLSREI